jgi:CheY-like chemotaxis protein
MDAPLPDPRPVAILVVDDDADLLALTRRILRPTGWDVVTALDADRALASARDMETLDVLFTDLVMPRRSGVELARELLDERPDVAVVFTTGEADDEMQAEVAASGRPLLRKPYTPDVLRQTLRAVVSDRRAAAELP